MMKLAVIGKDVAKSTSPQMHAFIARRLGREIEYGKVSVKEEEFESRIGDILAEYDGLNVTIPYKISIIPHLKRTEGDAVAFGAVNTVKTSSLTGYNTDGLGFMQMLASADVEVKGRKVLLLGAGGAGRSVAKKLADGGADVFVYDRHEENSYAAARAFKGVTALTEVKPSDYGIIINATGVGMHNTVGISPVGGEVIKSCSVAVDLIYEPTKSRFLEIAEELGKKIINGRAMLFYQAYYAECVFFSLIPDGGQAASLFGEYLKEFDL